MKSFIYIIKNPFTNQIRYIGQTSKGSSRFKLHIYDALKTNKNTAIINFIRSIFKQNSKPIFEILEFCEVSKLDERERYWIKYYRENGFKLLNLTDGGYGHRGFKQSQSSINKRIKKITGKKRSEEVKRLIGNLAKERAKTNPHYNKIGNLNKGKKFISERTKEALNRPEIKCKLTKNNLGKKTK